MADPQLAPSPSLAPVETVAGGAVVPPGAANPTIEPKTAVSSTPETSSTPPAAPSSAPPVASTPGVADADVEDDGEDAELPPLSPLAVGFLTSEYYAASNERLAKDFDLSTDDLSFLGEMDHMVLGGALPLDGYVRGLRGEFTSMSQEQREKLIARLVAEHFLPWDKAISPTAQEVARSEKLVLSGAGYYRVYSQPLTYGGAAAEIARAADIPALQGQPHERLRDLVMSRAKGIRVDAQVEEQLKRPGDMSGLGLSPEKAHAVVIVMNDIIKRAKLMTEDEYSAWLTEEARKKDAAKRKPAPSGVSTRESEEDAKEIAAIARNMPTPVRDTSSVLALSTQTLINRLSAKPSSDYLQKRLENLVSTRLRDVRSKGEVFAKLMRDEKVGGLGFDRATAEKTSAEIEDGYAEFHGLIADEEKGMRDVQVTAQAHKVEERKQREAEEHARWYQEKIQGKKMEEQARKDVVERMKVIAQGFTSPMTVAPHPVDIKEQAKEKKELGELVQAGDKTTGSGAVVSAPPMKIFTPATIPPAPSAPKETAVSAPSPVAPPIVRVSMETAKAAQAEQGIIRPRMDDVKVVRPRLEGPLQEIEGLTLASFRRLGKTPEEAIQQVEKKIELLGLESFEKHVQGIQAWQASPLQKSYLTLVAEAFSTAKPVNALSAQKRAAGQDVPSQEEIVAIVGLNGRLHF